MSILELMLLRNLKVVDRKMSDVELEREVEENEFEMVEKEENAEEGNSNVSGQLKEQRKESRGGDRNFEQMITLIREINKKMSREINEVRNEFKQNMEEILWEVRGVSEKWENRYLDMENKWEKEMKEMKMVWKNEIVEIKGEMQRIEKVTQVAERKDRRDSWMSGVEKNRKLITLLYEEVDECKNKWINKFSEIYNDTEGRINQLCEEMEIRVDQGLKKLEENSLEGRLRKINKEGGQEKPVDSVEHGGEENVGELIKRRHGMGIDPSLVKEIMPPKFEDNNRENPKKFIEEIEEFMDVKGVPEEWRNMWFRKCVGEKVLLWYEAIGRDTKDFQELKKKFLERYWNKYKQAEVVRRFYSPNKYKDDKMSKEQYLLAASEENKYLDCPLSERSLVGAISQHFGMEIAKHVMVMGVATVEEFAGILNAWEEMEKDNESWEKEVQREVEIIENRYENRQKWRNVQDKRRDNYGGRENKYGQYIRNENYAGKDYRYGRDQRVGNYGERSNKDSRNQCKTKERSKWNDRWRASNDRSRMQEVGVKNSSQVTHEGSAREEKLN